MDNSEGSRYQIRLARGEDIAELVRMQRELQRSMARIGTNMLHLHRTGVARLHEYYRAQIEDELVRLLVAQDRLSEDVVGMGSGRIWSHPDYVPPYSGELIDLWVDPDHRRQKLAERMLTRLLTFFRANRIEFLAVNYVRGNPLAEILWTKFGFHPALVTATAERRDIETALGFGAQRIVPIAAHRAGADRRLAVGIGSSG
jgi:ribosomal protein S18 acetylase RimI-like enzyme